MDIASWLAQSSIVEGLGVALVHFLWQGSLITLLLAGILRGLAGRSPAARYAVCCAALALMASGPVVTLALALSTPSDPFPGGTAAHLKFPAAAARSLAYTPFSPALPWTVAAWLAGVSFLSLRILAGYLRLRMLTRSAVAPAGSFVQECGAALARRIGVNRTVLLLESAVAQVPAVVGWIKPVVLIPAGLLTGLTSAQLESLLAHEFAHIRRYDYFVNLVQTAIETLLFYHPGVWWTSRQIRHEREHCCDDLAVAVCGDALTYARALTELERLRAEPQPAMAAAGGDLSRRIHRLVSPRQHATGAPASLALALGAVALLLGAAAVSSPSRAQEPSDPVVDELFSRLHAHDWVVEGEVKRLLDQATGNIQPFLAALHSRRDWQSREKAAWVLGMTRDPAAVESLIGALHDPAPYVRHTAAWALGTIGDARAIDPLTTILKDESSDLRAVAAWALGGAGDGRVVADLLAALRDSHADVRTAAAWALGSIGNAKASPGLTAALQDANAEVRRKAAEALARLRR